MVFSTLYIYFTSSNITKSGRLHAIEMAFLVNHSNKIQNDLLERLLITQEQRLVAIAARIEALEGDGR